MLLSPKCNIFVITREKEEVLIRKHLIYQLNLIGVCFEEIKISFKKYLKFPFFNTCTQTFLKIIEFCNKEVEIKKKNSKKKQKTKSNIFLEEVWTLQFFKLKSRNLFEIILASDYLGLKNLLILVASLISRTLLKRSFRKIKKILGY